MWLAGKREITGFVVFAPSPEWAGLGDPGPLRHNWCLKLKNRFLNGFLKLETNCRSSKKQFETEKREIFRQSEEKHFFFSASSSSKRP